MKKTQKISDWKQEEVNNQHQALLDKREQDEAQRQKEFDLKTYSYAVMKDGKEEHRTPYLSEALTLARAVNGKIWWVIEGVPTSEITFNQ